MSRESGPAMDVAAQSVRPEWLYEVASRVQAHVGPPVESWAPPRPDPSFQNFPPESSLEQQIVGGFAACLQAEEVRWAARRVGRIVPSAPSRDAGRRRTPKSPSLQAATETAEGLLRCEFEKHWTVEALARRVRCNRTHLEVGFSMAGLYTVHFYLTLCRVEAAKLFLTSTAWRIEEVAKAVGYRSKVSLFHSFRKVVGMSPDEYRRRWTWVPPNEHVMQLLSRLIR